MADQLERLAPHEIDEIIELETRKLRRQQAAVQRTQAHINTLETIVRHKDQIGIELLESDPKKGK